MSKGGERLFHTWITSPSCFDTADKKRKCQINIHGFYLVNMQKYFE